MSRPEIQFHDGMASKWETLHQGKVFQTRTRVMFSLVENLQLGRTWLDAGCGTGTLARLLARRGLDVQGVDASGEMVDAATRLSQQQGLTDRLTFQQIETVESLPFGNEAFDGVLCASVLEYVGEPERCLAEFRRVLKPGGLLLVSLPNRQSLLRKFYKTLYPLSLKVKGRPILRYLKYSVFETSIEDADALLKRHGFTVQAHSFGGSPLPRLLDGSRNFGTLLNILARREA